MYLMDLIEFLRALFCVAFDIRDPRIPACDIIHCLQLEIKNMFNISLLVIFMKKDRTSCCVRLPPKK